MTALPPPGALVAPAAARNREPILAVLREVLPSDGVVLEIASGSGEHVHHFAAALPRLTWQPSDPSPEACASIEAYREALRLPNVRPALALDARASEWRLTGADAVVAINMVHISPWAATLGLLDGAARLLPAGGPLVLYGPFREVTRPTAPSNEAFDADLRARDPSWGLRQLDDVAVAAASRGLDLERRVEMPANNLAVVFRRPPSRPLPRAVKDGAHSGGSS